MAGINRRKMKKLKSSTALGIAGILFILIGVFCFINPVIAYVELVRFSGVALLLNGFVLQMASSFAHISFKKEKISMVTESIVDFIFGLMLLLNPFATFILYPLLIGYWILCVAIIKIVTSFLVRKQIRGWLFILFIGLLSLGFALAIIFAPSTRVNEITLLFGAFFVCLGAVLIYDAYRLKRMHETIDLLF
jgi:uncharacterized membrane protein HdeD (DUF308 family)